MIPDSDLFEPYERLIEISILGVRVRVPENNQLLRCFQFLSLKTISYGEFCWNGECANCQIWFRHDAADEKPALACRTRVRENMDIRRLHECLRIAGVNAPADNVETRQANPAQE